MLVVTPVLWVYQPYTHTFVKIRVSRVQYGTRIGATRYAPYWNLDMWQEWPIRRIISETCPIRNAYRATLKIYMKWITIQVDDVYSMCILSQDTKQIFITSLIFININIYIHYYLRDTIFGGIFRFQPPPRRWALPHPRVEPPIPPPAHVDSRRRAGGLPGMGK